jgi:hypothetical protein
MKGGSIALFTVKKTNVIFYAYIRCMTMQTSICYYLGVFSRHLAAQRLQQMHLLDAGGRIDS